MTADTLVRWREETATRCLWSSGAVKQLLDHIAWQEGEVSRLVRRRMMILKLLEAAITELAASLSLVLPDGWEAWTEEEADANILQGPGWVTVRAVWQAWHSITRARDALAALDDVEVGND